MNKLNFSSICPRVSLGRRISTLSGGFEFLIAALTPVLLLLAIDPNSFISGWNEGRSGLLFASFFIILEWYDARKQLQMRKEKHVFIVWLLCGSLLVLYYFGIFFLNLNNTIGQIGTQLGLPEMPKMYSWVTMWEHLVFLTYILVLFVSAYGWKNLLKMMAPAAYLSGMGLMFLLDAAFPYASLGPMQAIVLVIVPMVVSLLGFSGIRTIWQPESSTLHIFLVREGVETFKGSVSFYWPCVGVQSMIIFFMIILVMIAKLDASRRRKTFYALIGAIGTFLLNLFRIYIICYLIATEGVSKARAFHESAGEILFMAWAVLYLLAVVKVEDIIYSKRTTLAHTNRETKANNKLPTSG